MKGIGKGGKGLVGVQRRRRIRFAGGYVPSKGVSPPTVTISQYASRSSEGGDQTYRQARWDYKDKWLGI